MTTYKGCYWYQWTLGFLLTSTDYFLTKEYVNIVGVSGEANPIERWVIEQFGTEGMLGFKISMFFLFGLSSFLFNSKEYAFATKLLTYINILMGVVIGWSLYLLIPLL